MLNHLITLAAIVFTSLPVVEVHAQNCDAILENGLRNIRIRHSNENTVETKYFKYCKKDYSSASESTIAEAEVEAFGYGSGSGNLSIQQRRENLVDWCKQSKDNAQSNKSSFESSSEIYQGAYDAWTKCNELANNGLKVNVIIPSDAMNVDVGLTYAQIGVDVKTTMTLYGVATEGFDCKAVGPSGEVSYPVALSTQSININCKRSASKVVKRESGEYNIIERGIITLNLSDKPFQIYFVPVEEPTISQGNADRIDGLIEALNDKIDHLSESIYSEIDLRVSHSEKSITSKLKKETMYMCPDNQTMSGANNISGVSIGCVGQISRQASCINRKYGLSDHYIECKPIIVYIAE